MALGTGPALDLTSDKIASDGTGASAGILSTIANGAACGSDLALALPLLRLLERVTTLHLLVLVQ